MKELKEEDILEIRRSAESMYSNGDFLCSEAVLKSILDGLEVDYAPDSIAMASGFAGGIGGGGCTCGAISGGVMAVGYFYGRSEVGSEKIAMALKKSKELYNDFIKNNRVSCCKALTKKFAMGSPEHKAQCVKFTGDMAESAIRIISDK